MTKKHLLEHAFILGASILLVISSAHAQTEATSSAKTQPAAKTTKVAGHHTQQFHSEGERVFVQNCSRCHNAPEGFSPRISGTVARHMRMRAQLSQHDEQELLRFLNP